MENFPYNVKDEYIKLNDGDCCVEMSDRTGWHFYRCHRKASKQIDGVGLCGIHNRMVENWRKK
jgi:hypothetical protein